MPPRIPPCEGSNSLSKTEKTFLSDSLSPSKVNFSYENPKEYDINNCILLILALVLFGSLNLQAVGIEFDISLGTVRNIPDPNVNIPRGFMIHDDPTPVLPNPDPTQPNTLLWFRPNSENVRVVVDADNFDAIGNGTAVVDIIFFRVFIREIYF